MLLRADNIAKHFKGVTAIQRLDFELEEGLIAGVIGPNGAGKTTFFNVLTGMLSPDKGGRIVFEDRDITGFRPDQIAKIGIARTFQNTRLFSSLSVLDHLLIGAHRVSRGWGRSLLGGGVGDASEADVRRNVQDLMDLLKLGPVAERPAATLPYGAQRRVELARALASFPKLLLLDEPTAGMLPTEADEMIGSLRKITAERSVTVLLIEHNMKVVMEVADRVTVLHEGARIAEAPPGEITRNPLVINAYLGRQYADSEAVRQ